MHPAFKPCLSVSRPNILLDSPTQLTQKPRCKCDVGPEELPQEPKGQNRLVRFRPNHPSNQPTIRRKLASQLPVLTVNLSRPLPQLLQLTQDIENISTTQCLIHCASVPKIRGKFCTQAATLVPQTLCLLLSI